MDGRKYTIENLIPPLRLFISARNEALKVGFTDNGGAIHSVERILDLLGLRIRYPHLSHINNLKTDKNAEISKKAHLVRMRGEGIFIEHVRPQRAFAREVIKFVDKGCSDQDLVEFIRTRYRLVLLSGDETKNINRMNRSKITEDRIADAGITLL